MKKLLVALNALLLVISLTCTGCDRGNHKPQNHPVHKISKIKIIDRTFLHYYMNGKTVKNKTITDPDEIKTFQAELDLMKEVQNMNIRYSFGFYEIILYFDDGRQEDNGLIYTIYDGVVFYNYDTNRAFKNNHMENLIRAYFPQRE